MELMLQGAAQVLLSMAPTTSEVSMIFIEVPSSESRVNP